MKVNNPAAKASERNIAHRFLWYGFVVAVVGAMQFGFGASCLVGGLMAFTLGLAYLLQSDT